MCPGVVSARVSFPPFVPAISYPPLSHSGQVGLLQTQVGLPQAQGLSSLDLARAKKIVPGPQFLAAHSGAICAGTCSDQFSFRSFRHEALAGHILTKLFVFNLFNLILKVATNIVQLIGSWFKTEVL